MRGNVKWFNAKKGYGFITDSDGKDIFVHQTAIQMEGFRTLGENDIVDFEIETTENGKTQAVNVQPILSYVAVAKSLKNEGLFSRAIKNTCGNTVYLVEDANNVLQSPQTGFSLVDLAAYAGFDTEGLQ